MPLINTTHGELEESTLARTVGFEDRPNEFVVWVEWRLGEELVRRDAHVILKYITDGANVLAQAARPADVTVGLQGVSATSDVGGFGG